MLSISRKNFREYVERRDMYPIRAAIKGYQAGKGAI